MKHPSTMAMKIVQKYVQVNYTVGAKDSLEWGVFVGDDRGVCEFFADEHQANKAALHVIYPIAHAIDALIAKVKENQGKENEAGICLKCSTSLLSWEVNCPKCDKKKGER